MIQSKKLTAVLIVLASVIGVITLATAINNNNKADACGNGMYGGGGCGLSFVEQDHFYFY